MLQGPVHTNNAEPNEQDICHCVPNFTSFSSENKCFIPCRAV
jgi:hypothetical protein